ncbi:MAG: O-antigen ligase domain-containing protein, partial [Pedobacter sp.]
YYIFKKEGFLKYFSIVGLGLVFFALFLINARSAFVGIMLSLIILLATLGYVYWKEKNLKFYFTRFAFIASAFAITFFISQQSLIKATEDKSSTYGTIGARLGGITDQTSTKSNIRLAYWKGSYELIKKRPLMGVGFGNWKVYAPLYTNTLLNDNTFSKHPHNDFIEIAGETGIPNALLFLAIFAVALFLTFKVIKTDANVNTKIIAIVAFASLTGYFVDAFFNFPGERPNVQLLFALALSLLLASWMSLKPKQQEENVKYNLAKSVSLVLIFICGVSIYANAMVYKSSKAQYITDNDFAAIDNIPNALPKLKYEEVKNMFPAIPNIGENSETIGYKKARYLYKEKRYAEAIKLLDSVHHQSPNIIYDDYLKCNIYLEDKKLDSAYKYGKKAAYAKPRNFYYYRMASYLARIHEDIPEINKLFKNYSKYRDDQQSWSYYSLSMFFSKADRKEVKKVVDMGLKKFPTDTIMLSYVPYLPK